MKKLAQDLEKGDVITSLILDPEGPFIVDYVAWDEDNEVVKVEGYVEHDGSEFSFIWGFEKELTTDPHGATLGG